MRRGRRITAYIIITIGADTAEVLGRGDAEELLHEDIRVEDGDVRCPTDEVVGGGLHLVVDVVAHHRRVTALNDALQDVRHHLHIHYA